MVSPLTFILPMLIPSVYHRLILCGIFGAFRLDPFVRLYA
jgi:hypothetical protein